MKLIIVLLMVNTTIDIDGYNGPMPPMTVSCEFIASGTGQGGWTLILNYLHNANTNPELEVRHYSLPTKNSDSLLQLRVEQLTGDMQHQDYLTIWTFLPCVGTAKQVNTLVNCTL